jgi:hypothetical protein
MNVRHRDFQCQYGFIKGYKYHLPYTACVFCKHCTDIFWDFSGGIYGLICEKNMDIRQIKGNITGECKHFIEEKEEIV